MDRAEVLRWLKNHSNEIQGSPESLIVRCERTVRRHAAEDAWRSAKVYVETRMPAWENEWGAHAGEVFVAKEICHQLAYELKHHEPEIEAGAEELLAGGTVHNALTDEGWSRVSEWVREIAREEEHEVWRDIIRFTDKRGAEIARRFGFKADSDYDHTRGYSEIAAQVAGILATEYSQQAHPRH